MKKRFFLLFCTFNIIFSFFYLTYAYEENAIAENEQQEMLINNATDELGLVSEGAVLLEMNSGRVLYDKNMNERLFPASITKILTAILVLENCDDLNDKATASEYAVTSITDGYTTAGIKIGESFTIEELLEVMMLRSANEAATILAEYVSGSIEEFSKLMNEKAKEIGCKDSNFLNANGMHDDNHYSTAYDMALIERYCMQNKEFRRISALTECSLPNTELYDKEPRVFKNTHAFLLKDSPYYYEYAIAGKTGFTTPAKNCLVTCSNKDGFELVAVILHAEGKVDGVSARYSDTKKLLDYGYNNYKYVNFLKKGSTVSSIQIETVDGKKENLDLELCDDIKIIAKSNEKVNSSNEEVKLNDISLPIKKGDILGTITYRIFDNDYTVNISSTKDLDIESQVSNVTFETEKEYDFIPILMIIGFCIIEVIVVVIFIFVIKKDRTEKLNFS